MGKINSINKLVLIGNGFDLAHGLQTSYKAFIDWYFCQAVEMFKKEQPYSDGLIEIKNRVINEHGIYGNPKTVSEALKLINDNSDTSIDYKSQFLQNLVQQLIVNNWVDIECYYYRRMKVIFRNSSFSTKDKRDLMSKLNSEFDLLIQQLSAYLKFQNTFIDTTPKLSSQYFNQLFEKPIDENKLLFLNFNYTDTLIRKGYAKEEDIVFIHGRITDLDTNPIIFGYGDETDPVYQQIEDTGENIYLEHIKSFGYFRTNNYHRLLSYIDSAPYSVSIVGHSCGLSDRVLLNEIFEHPNCKEIEIFYHQRSANIDNFKETTQEISRHFKHQSKNAMRRKVIEKNINNVIPQNVTIK